MCCKAIYTDGIGVGRIFKLGLVLYYVQELYEIIDVVYLVNLVWSE